MRDEFISCGITSTEYEVLMHLLARGPRGAGTIAKGLGLKRSTVYSALQALEGHKLVTRSRHGGPATFRSVAAQEIPSLLLNRAKSQFESVLSSVRLIEPRIQKFENRDAFNAGEIDINHVDNTRDYFTLLKKYTFSRDFCAVWNPRIAISSPAVQSWVQDFLTATARRKSRIKDILVDGPMTRWYISMITNPHHQVRVLPQGESGIADLTVVDDVVILSLNSPGTECALEIRNPHYASFMQWYFLGLWERLPQTRLSSTTAVEVVENSNPEATTFDLPRDERDPLVTSVSDLPSR